MEVPEREGYKLAVLARLQLLLGARDVRGALPLHAAAYKGNAEGVRLLLESTEAPSESLRTNAIRLLAGTTYDDETQAAVSSKVHEWAAARLQASFACEDEGSARQGMLLYLTLCAKEPPLLRALFDGEVPPEAPTLQIDVDALLADSASWTVDVDEDYMEGFERFE